MAPPSDRIAVAVALLLPEAAEARARAANQTLRRGSPDGFAFDDTHLPHLTLLQQVTRVAAMPELLARTGGVLAGFGPLDLEATGVRAGGSSSACLVVATGAELRRLHRELFMALAPLADAEVDAAAFHDPGGEPPREPDLAWVRDFRARASGESFWPHVTLGVGAVPVAVAPFSFTSGRVVVCHLGRHCTCRLVLAEWRLALPA